MMVNLSEVKSLYQQGNVIWKDHAAKRMKQRGIRVRDVEDCIMTGEIIRAVPAGKSRAKLLDSGYIKC